MMCKANLWSYDITNYVDTLRENIFEPFIDEGIEWSDKWRHLDDCKPTIQACKIKRERDCTIRSM